MFIADLHIHSKYSRATSPELCFEQLYAWGRRKGVGLIGTGDCTHPGWRAEIREKLEPAGDGLLRLKAAPAEPDVAPEWSDEIRFLLTGEISTIYKADGATRKVHHVVCLPSLDAADEFARRLERIGNIASDGRPILGLDSRDLLEILLEASPDAVLIPAHIWTPWFSVLGSKSGFDNIESCYRDLSGHIFALETGLSSDPAMNWTVSGLDRFALVSNSDAHSPAKLGREANVFDCDMGYTAVMHALRRQAPGFRGTLEFFPEEGKYHYDGHRKCNFACTPEESKALGGRCPTCNALLTLGVEYRVTELADRPRGTRPEGAEGYTSLLSLAEVLGELNGTSGTSKKVGQLYDTLLAKLGPELFILMDADREQIRTAGGEFLARAIEKVRTGEIHATPGYDGEYGVIRVFNEEERAEVLGQVQLFEGVSLESPTKARTRVSRETPPADLAAVPTPVEQGLSAEQKQAVEHPQGPLVILAGPGAGKTHTLVGRIARLTEEEGADPASILALTFSNRAAREMAERLGARLPGPVHPTVGTFHKIGFRLISEYRELLQLPEPLKILSEDEADALFAETSKGTVPGLDDLERALTLLYAGATGDADELQRLAEKTDALAPEYAAAKRVRGALDFTDLLLLPLTLLARHEKVRRTCRERWRHVFVDEYQDVNVFQYLLLRLLCPPPLTGLASKLPGAGNDLCVIGDPDQAIYGFRGADVRYFLRFREDYPGAGLVALTRNYRSSSTIVRAGAGLITCGGLLGERALWSDRPGPERIQAVALPTPGSEAEYVVQTIEGLLGGISHFSVDSGRGGEGSTDLGFSDIAVLYRTHALGEEVQAAFERSGIPYQRAARKDLLQHPEIRRVLAQVKGMPGELPATRALLEACLALSITEDALKQHPWPGLLTRAEEAESLAAFLHGLSLDRDIDIYDPRAARVALMTAHAAKGLEWEVVFLIGCEEGSFPHPAAPADEERRLFYVAMTRAKTHLFLTHAASRAAHGERETRWPSPFLDDIPPDLLCHTTPARPAKPRNTQLPVFEISSLLSSQACGGTPPQACELSGDIMTPKAWIKAVVAHQDTGRVPYNYSFSPPAAKRLREHYGVEDIPNFLDLPFRMIGLNSCKPMYAGPDEYGPTVTDEFGVVWATTHIDRGVPLEHPLTEPDLSGFTFPDPHDPARWAGLAEYLEQYKDYYTGVRTGELWERATFLRGMEDLLFDLIENRPFVDELLERQTEYTLQVMEHALTLGDFDCFYLSDDYGAQRSLLMSPADWRALIKPRLARLYAFAKAHGRQTYLHSCGCVQEVIPDLIEIGLDMLHPIQPETMDIFWLKREYGQDITFCGGLRTQDLLPLGTPDEVRAEVRKLKREMGAGGGYVMEPGITLQDDVPLANIVALVEEAMVVN